MYLFADESHAPVVLKAIKNIAQEWEILGLFLGIENDELKAIKFNRWSQVEVCKKDVVCQWIKLGSATREGLISALENVERNDIAAEIKRLEINGISILYSN